MPDVRYRVHIVPWMRVLGSRFLIPEWLAITIGRDIFAWRDMDPYELAHEVQHVRQWKANGVLYVPRYLLASWRAWRAGKNRYLDNEFEIEARAVAEAARDTAGNAPA